MEQPQMHSTGTFNGKKHRKTTTRLVVAGGVNQASSLTEAKTTQIAGALGF